MAREGRRGRGWHDKPPPVYRRGTHWYVDLRRWNKGRVVMRDPSHPRWPEKGEKTEYEDVAKEWAVAYLRHHQDRKRRRQTGRPEETPSLSVAIERWLEHREMTVMSGTLETDRAVTNHLLDHFQNTIPLGAIGTSDLQGFFSKMLRRGYKATTLANYYSTTQALFGHFDAKEVLDGVELPDPGEMDARAWTDEEVDELRGAADTLGPHYRMVIEVGVATGARRAELCGMRWSDFNPTRKTVRIERQLVRGTRRMRPLKGKRARTVMVLPGFWGWFDDTEGYVIGEGDRPVPDRTLYRWFTKVAKAAGLDESGVGLHSLRHTYARKFLEEGGSHAQLQKFLGHKSVTTTEEVYGHFGDEAAVRLARNTFYD